MPRGRPFGSGVTPLAVRFWAKVEKKSADECWPWLGAKLNRGYGKLLGNDRKIVLAHRVSWEIANGSAIPDGLFVCHHCDNPPCVNPTHLFLGTQLDNMRDMVGKGHQSASLHPESFRGAKNGRAKLTEDDVRAIRLAHDGHNAEALAAEYGVSDGTIYSLLSGKTWRHI